MAMSAVRRLAQRVIPQARHASTMVVKRSDAATRPTAKVSDRIIKLTAIDEDGQRHAIQGLIGNTLLKTLVQGGLFDPERHRLEDVDACSAECEVSIASEWLDKLPPRSEEELDVLKARTFESNADPHARLGCQIVLEPKLDGMVVSIAEEKPWRTL